MEKFLCGIKDSSSLDKKEYYTMIPCYDKDDRDDIQLIKSYFKYNISELRNIFSTIKWISEKD